MAAKKKKGKGRGKRGKSESLSARIGRQMNRLLILVTTGVIALYLLPLSSRMLDDGEDIAISAIADPVTVEVLNGCGEEGIALKVTRYLRDGGCDVQDWRNAGHFHHKTTRILARNGEIGDAERVRAALGFGEVAAAPDSTLHFDVTVIIGSDCNPFPPEAAVE